MTLVVEGTALAPGTMSEVIFDVTLADVVDGTMLVNVASFESPPDGDSGDEVGETETGGGSLTEADGCNCRSGGPIATLPWMLPLRERAPRLRSHEYRSHSSCGLRTMNTRKRESLLDLRGDSANGNGI